MATCPDDVEDMHPVQPTGKVAIQKSICRLAIRYGAGISASRALLPWFRLRLTPSRIFLPPPAPPPSISPLALQDRSELSSLIVERRDRDLGRVSRLNHLRHTLACTPFLSWSLDREARLLLCSPRWCRQYTCRVLCSSWPPSRTPSRSLQDHHALQSAETRRRLTHQTSSATILTTTHPQRAPPS